MRDVGVLREGSGLAVGLALEHLHHLPQPGHLVSQRLVVATQPGGLRGGAGVVLLELAKRRSQAVTLKSEGCNGPGQPGVVGFVEGCLEPPVFGIEPTAHLREGGHFAAEALQHPMPPLVLCNRT
jgi:hypothetical protein